MSGELKPLVQASLAQCEAPGAVDWLAPQLMGALYRLINHAVGQANETFGGRDREVVAVRVYGELSGVAEVFVATALKVHRDGTSPRFQAAARRADELHAALSGRIDTSDPAMRQAHGEAKAMLAGPMSATNRQALEHWPRRPGWHVAFLLWQRAITEPMSQARHAYHEPGADHPVHAIRRQIAAALTSIGRAADDPLPIVFANLAAVETTAAILERNGVFLELKGQTWSPERGGLPARHDEKLVAGLLAFHIRREFLRRLGLELEDKFPRALMVLFGDISQTESTVLLREVARAIAKLSNRETGEAIERAVGAWVDRPGAETFDRLLRLYDALAVHAGLLKAA